MVQMVVRIEVLTTVGEETGVCGLRNYSTRRTAECLFGVPRPLACSCMRWLHAWRYIHLA